MYRVVSYHDMDPCMGGIYVCTQVGFSVLDLTTLVVINLVGVLPLTGLQIIIIRFIHYRVSVLIYNMSLLLLV